MKIGAVSLTDLSIIRYPESQTGADVAMQVLLHNKPVPNATMYVRLPGIPEQKLQTDADGKVTFHAPKPGRYFALVTLKFDTPGTFRGIHYDVFREKASFTVVTN